MFALAACPAVSDIEIHRDIPYWHRPPVDGNQLGQFWYAVTNSDQAGVVHPGWARELTWSAKCWQVEVAGSVFAETSQLWSMEPALL